MQDVFGAIAFVLQFPVRGLLATSGAVTPVLARRSEVAKERCLQLSERHAGEEILLAAPPNVEDNEGGLLHRVRDGVRYFHELML